MLEASQKVKDILSLEVCRSSRSFSVGKVGVHLISDDLKGFKIALFCRIGCFFGSKYKVALSLVIFSME